MHAYRPHANRSFSHPNLIPLLECTSVLSEVSLPIRRIPCRMSRPGSTRAVDFWRMSCAARCGDSRVVGRRTIMRRPSCSCFRCIRASPSPFTTPPLALALPHAPMSHPPLLLPLHLPLPLPGSLLWRVYAFPIAISRSASTGQYKMGSTASSWRVRRPSTLKSTAGTHAHMHTNTHTRKHTRARARARRHAHIHTRTQTHTHTHTRTHARTHTHAHTIDT